jgi:hypothetical protein
MLKSDVKLTMEQLRKLEWKKVTLDFLEDFTNYDFYISDVDNDGISDDIALLKRAVFSSKEIVNGQKVEIVSPVTPILYGALRTILTTRKKDVVRENLKVYFAGIKDPSMLPDCKAHKVHKWHLVEDSSLEEGVKYSYFETSKYLIVIRHKWMENDSCIVFIYEKPVEPVEAIEEEKK